MVARVLRIASVALTGVLVAGCALVSSMQPTEKGVVSGGPAPSGVFQSACLKRAGTRVALTGPQSREYHVIEPANTVIDASTAKWSGASGGLRTWPITIDGPGPVCWYGGTFDGDWDDSDPAITWENPYHHSGGITIRAPGMLVEGLRIDNQGDGVNVDKGGTNFDLRGIHLSNIHDDCIQDDYLYSGKIEDSFLESCYVGFSAAWTNLPAGTGIGNVLQIDNTLEHSSCSVPYYTRADSCYGLWFKGWYETDIGPNLILRNDIFRFDQISGQMSFSEAQYTVPNNAKFLACSNNIIVWTGPGNFPYPLPSCFKVTKDVSVWNDAVATWKANHPANAN
jgi:hypothetical protein